jgi:protein phosphatase
VSETRQGRDLGIPQLALVVLIGPSGSGKSTFARRCFKPTEVLSSDFCRGLVSDDENRQAATADAFDVLHFVAAKRLAAGKLTVIDATNVQREARKPLVALAREYHCLPVAIVLNIPEKICCERNRGRADRAFGPHVIRQQCSRLRSSLRHLKDEGFRHVLIIESAEEADTAVIERQPLWCDLKSDHGPFDIIGDVHGCCDELEDLLAKLGYERQPGGDGPMTYRHAAGRKAVFLGDILDRGPRILDTYRIVSAMVAAGTSLCVPGNHDVKLLRKLRGKDVQATHGLDRTLAEIEGLNPETRESFCRGLEEFLDALISHYVLDDGKLVVAHAGMRGEMQGRGSGKVREFALYGETTGETDEYGLPVRHNWAAEYRGEATVVYGHTPVPEPEWLNRTINIDTGCVFGGKLSALRYPELELVSVPARRAYCEAIRPLVANTDDLSGLSAQHQQDDLLDIDDVLGKRIIHTRLHHTVTVSEEHASAALEVMSRFCANPKWLIYLPPTMSPCESSALPGLLEHPAEAFAYYEQQGVPRVVCEEKHMGSRGIVVICRDEEVARGRFGVVGEGIGICYTRTGRGFFGEKDTALERAMLSRVHEALTASSLWDELQTDWVCLDCELMPWSVKAQTLLEGQYASVGAAARAALPDAIEALQKADDRTHDLGELLARHRARIVMASRFVQAYQGYCWPVRSVSDLKLAPFHIMATENKVHTDKDHVWHMNTLARLCAAGPGLLHSTAWKSVDVGDTASVAEAVAWWEELTSHGGEGMVVKPQDFVVKGRRGLVQPAIKCRGREYLRIIYGPEYDAPENIARLRMRGVGAKRSLALREFALGIESLERFVRREPLRRTHECVFAVLALECEPVDPRL